MTHEFSINTIHLKKNRSCVLDLKEIGQFKEILNDAKIKCVMVSNNALFPMSVFKYGIGIGCVSGSDSDSICSLKFIPLPGIASVKAVMEIIEELFGAESCSCDEGDICVNIIEDRMHCFVDKIKENGTSYTYYW